MRNRIVGSKVKRSLSNILGIFVLSVFLIGCSKEPNDVGFGLLPDNELFNVKVYEDSVEIYAENIQNFISNSSSNILLIGNYDGISCDILIRFDIPDTLRDIKIEWAQVRLFKSGFVMGDSTLPVHFTAHKVLSNYYDTLYDSRIIGEFESVPDSVNYFKIDTGVVREWLNGKNYGLYLKSQSNGVIWGFNSLDAPLFTPALEIAVPKEGGGVDTIRFVYGSDGYIAKLNERIDTNYIVLQAGVGLRSILRFNVSKLPKNIIINRAEVSLYLKDKRKYGERGDSLIASFITDINLVRSSTGGFEGDYLGLKNPVDTLEYVIPITTPVQRWVNGEPNNGILLRCLSEVDNFDRFTFYYVERKPKLKIYYTTKPEI
ncbi:hypothetical protein JGI14_100829 [Candidatus Kryptonium thompsonii]|uniref:DNRLRE domain-containing protein n=2 Tax=Candidatus Kryptonium thompsonii TaxID=1633631 RepID=A0A0P1MD27_9BACT|nr:hypothetical protein [Candidatus Kryptonium thompsoni]CUS76948.1 hypothetical protein JGI15_100165 [Candidatus Kryptonium thompsoni]CUS79441.1 hypothetical protein JGI10_00398 [Candidatus Kryptonium thompsoni]CUS80629.1 hypothetical protein JGI14_100829 [Candidatus Kryptonium thompsoni]CUS92966.1 hypothetical protein JGI13_02165 [Candidatus Kryptonium thompsoni]CUS93642.1 hypothetical protein JGI8_01852 [Candidatus Kryptonium thompsoni]